MQNGQQMKITDDEIALLKSTFAGNDNLVKLLRKIFLPELTNTAPLGMGSNIDLWMTIRVEDLTPEQALINLKARNSLINHTEQCLMQISVLAGQKNESVAETKAKLEMNSAK